MSKCVMCGSHIPDGQQTCSMCCGDPEQGSDGYYRQYLQTWNATIFPTDYTPALERIATALERLVELELLEGEGKAVLKKGEGYNRL